MEAILPPLNGVALIARERRAQRERWGDDHDAEHHSAELTRVAQLYAEAAIVGVFAERTIGIVERTARRLDPDIDLSADEDLIQMRANAARHHWGWDSTPDNWPWEPESWRPSPDPIRNLVKAGALIAAEIDRLLRERGEA